MNFNINLHFCEFMCIIFDNKGGAKMSNRIKELRLKKGLTLKKMGKNIGMLDSTLSQYETGNRSPKKEEIWQKLADFFGVSVPYLQGAYSEDEIIKIAQDTYNSRLYNSDSYRNKDFDGQMWINIFTSSCDELFIYDGSVPYNIEKEELLLSEEQANSFEFWQKEFTGFFTSSVAMKWLINKPYLNATHEDVIKLLIDVINAEIAYHPNVIGGDQRAHFARLMKRKEFLEQYKFNRAPHPADGNEYE